MMGLDMAQIAATLAYISDHPTADLPVHAGQDPDPQDRLI
jgi:hypothetical protein